MIVCINDAEDLLFANEKALQLLKIPANNPDNALSSHYKTLGLFRTICAQQPIRDEVVHIGSELFVVNCFPMHFTLGTFGAAAFFNTVSSIQDMNKKIGKKIYSSGFQASTGIHDIFGKSPAILRLKERIRQMAQADAAVLIQGATGTGKELVANAIHRESQRKHGPFVAVNCAAITETLMESELFGYEGGAFTGASPRGKAGLFEMAHGGTLFLDELGEMSRSLQLRLLRVLETKKLIRVGGSALIPVNVRIISATNKNLLQLAHLGEFRMDLYYRIATLAAHVPPLSERLEDIPWLLGGILSQYDKPADIFSQDILDRLQKHPWRGNVRELLSVAERYILQMKGNKPDEGLLSEILSEYIVDNDKQLQVSGLLPDTGSRTLKETLHVVRRSLAEKALAEFRGNKEEAAKSLGLSVTSLWRILHDSDVNLLKLSGISHS